MRSLPTLSDFTIHHRVEHTIGCTWYLYDTCSSSKVAYHLSPVPVYDIYRTHNAQVEYDYTQYPKSVSKISKNNLCRLSWPNYLLCRRYQYGFYLNLAILSQPVLQAQRRQPCLQHGQHVLRSWRFCCTTNCVEREYNVEFLLVNHYYSSLSTAVCSRCLELRTTISVLQ